MYALFINESKRLRNIYIFTIALYCLSLMIGLTIRLDKNDIDQYIMISTLGALIIGVICVPCISFSYLHSKLKANHMHSLPYSKKQLFLMKYCSGLCCLMIPMILYLFVSYISFNKIENCLLVLILASLLTILYYTIHCLIVSVTGTVRMQLFLFGFVIVMPIFLYTSVQVLLSEFVRGLVVSVDFDIVTYIIFPISYFIKAWASMQVETYYLLWFALVSILLFEGSMLLVKNNHLEYAGTSIIFHKATYVIKFIIVLVFTWIISSIIVSGTNTTSLISGIFIIIVVTTALSFFSEVSKHGIKYGRIIIQTILITILTLGTFQVASATLKYYVPSNANAAGFSYNPGYDRPLSEIVYSKNPEIIDTIKEIHQICLDDEEYQKEYNILNSDEYYDNEIYLSYQLSGGKKVERQYTVSKNAGVKINQIIKESKYPDIMMTFCYQEHFQIINDKVESITININSYETMDIKSKEDISLFQSILKKQLSDYTNCLDYLDVTDNHVQIVGDISVQFENDFNYISYGKNDPLEKAIKEYINIKQID